MRRLRYRRYPSSPISITAILGLVFISITALGASTYVISGYSHDVLRMTRQVMWFVTMAFYVVALNWMYKFTVWMTYKIRRLHRRVKHGVREEEDD